MILFSLRCDHGHGFESWFRDGDSFEAQAKRKLISCPVCGSGEVEKAPMAPAVVRADRGPKRGPETVEEAPAEAPVPAAVLPPEAKALREMVRALRRHVEANAEAVGPRFAEEARKMHYGEIEHRAIYGSATPDEAQELREEGVAFQPLPILPDERN